MKSENDLKWKIFNETLTKIYKFSKMLNPESLCEGLRKDNSNCDENKCVKNHIGVLNNTYWNKMYITLR